MSRGIVFTPKQKDALKKLKSAVKYLLLYGGSRSGKTYVVIEYIVRQCLKYDGLRALIARHAFAHIKASIWMDTLANVLKTYKVFGELYVLNNTDLYVKFINGSELFLAGLDDSDRVEKILGREFAIIYLNECSQIDYSTVTVVKTRLAQLIPGFSNMMIYDENPPSPLHWTYKLFIEKIDPSTEEPLKDPEAYDSIQMNPTDNLNNLPDGYLDTLESLPERQKRRFLYGEFVKVEGAIYEDFDVDKNVISIDDIPAMQYFTVGIDNTGTNFAATLIGWSGENIYVLAEHSAFRQTMQNFDADIQHKWRQYNYVAYPDPAAAQLNDLIWNAAKSDNAVEPGINYIRQKISARQFFLIRNKSGKINTPGLLNEMNSYRYDDKGRILKENDHFLDSVRYASYSHAKYGASIIRKI